MPFMTTTEARNYEIPTGTKVDLIRMIGTLEKLSEARRADWAQPQSVADVKVGQVAYVTGYGSFRRGVVVKVGRTNITVAFTTQGAYEQACDPRDSRGIKVTVNSRPLGEIRVQKAQVEQVEQVEQVAEDVYAEALIEDDARSLGFVPVNLQQDLVWRHRLTGILVGRVRWTDQWTVRMPNRQGWSTYGLGIHWPASDALRAASEYTRTVCQVIDRARALAEAEDAERDAPELKREDVVTILDDDRRWVVCQVIRDSMTDGLTGITRPLVMVNIEQEDPTDERGSQWVSIGLLRRA